MAEIDKCLINSSENQNKDRNQAAIKASAIVVVPLFEGKALFTLVEQ
jgi:hypothetical protein